MNKTGIYPSGNRVVVKPDNIEEMTEGGIIIAKTILDKHQEAQSTGVLVAVGPDSFCHTTTTKERLIDGQWKKVERTRTGYSEAFADVGDRIAFAKYGGLKVVGADGEEYRILNDEDITCRVSDEVSFTDIESRKRVGS